MPFFTSNISQLVCDFNFIFLGCCETDSVDPQVAGPYPDKDANKYQVWFLRIHDRVARRSPEAKTQDQSAYWRVNAGDREL